ncbi:hypothetical protein PHYSODRAFT_310240 [Phytophthora sojae]|uniref:Uncharacterized protein n=1 Tax=Phytophthora sojae (strain P6497) TaxID=1094619 RepID=G4YND6_PHYSP|nr:hypothetical protein PHYSODRAFT_310240 [Phytophthora sojae]EGZ30229.1 hypothetical protein PHYSODRAFT_310240 [Phytophthora sojae]|eukprot:XP_009517504.1 hypothetical protein PHYSODRAFT_310240 [Phytophthora sojae]
MPFPIMLNINNQVSTHQYKYTFSRPVDLSKFKVALGSVTSDINNYLQYWSIQNNLYYINNTTGQYKYFISCAENPSAYALQFTMSPYVAQAGYTAANGALAVSTSGYTPQIQIIDSGSNSFGSIVGLSQATYPPAQQAILYSVSSNLVPQIDHVASVIVGVSNLANPLANNNQVLHSFTSAGVDFGGLITTSQGQGIAFTPVQGTTNELLVSFYSQDMLPLQITDPNLCIRLLCESK